MKPSFLLIPCLLLLAQCAPKTDSAMDAVDIVHGQRLKKSDPLSSSTVALVIDHNQGQALCSGSILSDVAILTAAHCVEDNPDHLTVVFAGNVRVASESLIRHAQGYVQHSGWQGSNGSGDNDLAIVYFSGGLPAGFAPVQLANSQNTPKQGSEVQLVGFGVTNGSRHTGAGILRITRTTVMGEHGAHQTVTDGRTSSVCFGDSGGPAFTATDGKALQWGVASSVANEGCNEASVHTNVAPYLRWIHSNMRQVRSAQAQGD